MIDPAQQALIQKYGRAIIHLRQQLERTRLGLVVGAGVNRKFSFPTWSELIERIAEDPQVSGVHDIDDAGAYGSRSQMLFQRLRQAMRQENPNASDDLNEFDTIVSARWRDIVRTSLYRNVSNVPEILLANHPYIAPLLSVIKKSPMTVTYNFDDTLEVLLHHDRATRQHRASIRNKGYKVLWNSNVPVPAIKPVIYHPNGYLPRDEHEKPSDQLVFLEDTFADQLIDSMSGHYAALVNHLAQDTCLLLGLSLDDPTLKHLLRQNARLRPANVHYYVSYLDASKAQPSEQAMRAIADSNFEVYNLVTLFLTDADINLLLTLLVDLEEHDFRHEFETAGVPWKMSFLVTGCVSVGKTSTVSCFQSIESHDEWLDPLPAEMSQDPSSLTEAQKHAVDTFVVDQIALKNRIVKDAGVGIHITDRAPLDAFAFTPAEEWQTKASSVLAAIRPGNAQDRLVDSHVIFLGGDADTMRVRGLIRSKGFSVEQLRRQQAKLERVYINLCESGGVSRIDTREKSLMQVVREVARVIFVGEYGNAKLHSLLERIAAAEIAAEVNK